MTHTLVGDKCLEQSAYVYLVWGITKDGTCYLVGVAARETSRERMENFAWASKSPKYVVVRAEEVIIDHVFGESVLPNALNKAAQKASWKRREGD